jgi:hypothetical protein
VGIGIGDLAAAAAETLGRALNLFAAMTTWAILTNRARLEVGEEVFGVEGAPVTTALVEVSSPP